MNFFKFPFTKDYDSEQQLKGIAKSTYVMWIVFAALSVLVGIILTIVFGTQDGLDVGLIVGVSTIGGGLFVASQGCILTHFVWGFGELIGNSKRINIQTEEAKKTIAASKKSETFDDLPEL